MISHATSVVEVVKLFNDLKVFLWNFVLFCCNMYLINFAINFLFWAFGTQQLWLEKKLYLRQNITNIYLLNHLTRQDIINIYFYII